MPRISVSAMVVFAVTFVHALPGNVAAAEELQQGQSADSTFSTETVRSTTAARVFYELVPESTFTDNSGPAPWLGIRLTPFVASTEVDPEDEVAATPVGLFPSLASVTIGGSASSSTVDHGTLESLQLADSQAQQEFARNWGTAELDSLYYPGTSAVKTPCRLPLFQTSNPLYFEQRQLERCGESAGYLTTACSFTRFVADFILLPAHIAGQCPGDEVRLVDNHCNCSECAGETVEISAAQILAEGGVITALLFIIP